MNNRTIIAIQYCNSFTSINIEIPFLPLNFDSLIFRSFGQFALMSDRLHLHLPRINLISFVGKGKPFSRKKKFGRLAKEIKTIRQIKQAAVQRRVHFVIKYPGKKCTLSPLSPPLQNRSFISPIFAATDTEFIGSVLAFVLFIPNNSNRA